MGKKRFTDTEKFNDKWYRKLPILQKVIWEYLLSECNHAGILENFDIELMSFKIGAEISQDDLKFFDGRIIFISDSVVFIPKFLNFQYGEFKPTNKVHLNALRELKKYNISAPWAERVRTGDGPKEKEKDKEKEKEEKKEINNSTSKFIKPSIEEIKNYCVERKNNVNPEQFYDFYESKNWMVGKNKMKKWKNAIHTWERNVNCWNMQNGKTEIESGNRYGSVEQTKRLQEKWRKEAEIAKQEKVDITKYSKIVKGYYGKN